jgi:hypothetical protein
MSIMLPISAGAEVTSAGAWNICPPPPKKSVQKGLVGDGK